MLHFQPPAPVDKAPHPVACLIELPQPMPPIQVCRCSQGLPESVIAETLNRVRIMIHAAGTTANRFNS